MNLLFKITYGLYLLSSEAEGKHGGCVINTLSQQTSEPERFSVTVNKMNFTHDLIAKSGKFAVALLSKKVKFDLIKGFGMRSGRDADKFADVDFVTAQNGCKVPTEGVLGFFGIQHDTRPYPHFDTSLCRRCLKCAEVCPAKALELRHGRIHIDKHRCIHCYCCHEMCPFDAIKIK